MVRTRPSSTIWSAPCEPETCSGRTWTSLSGTGRAAPRHHVLSAWSPSSGSAARRGYSTRGLGQETPGSGRHVTNHRSTTWQPRNPSVTSTWQPRNNHVITTRQPRDPHVTNTWSPREQVERYGDTFLRERKVIWNRVITVSPYHEHAAAYSKRAIFVPKTGSKSHVTALPPPKRCHDSEPFCDCWCLGQSLRR